MAFLYTVQLVVFQLSKTREIAIDVSGTFFNQPFADNSISHFFSPWVLFYIRQKPICLQPTSSAPRLNGL